MKEFIMRKKQRGVIVIAMLLLLCIIAVTSVACKVIDGSTDDPEVDYGTMSLSLPSFNSEDGENVLLAGYKGRKIKVDFSKPEYATDKIEWSVEEGYADYVKVQNGVVSATENFPEPKEVKVKATSEHFNGELVLTIKNFEGEYLGNRLFLSSKTELLLDKMKEMSETGDIETGGLLFIGDDYFDTKYFANVYSIYEGKTVNAVGIEGTTVADWQYLAEKLVYPVAPDYIAVHIGANDLKEGRAGRISEDLFNLFSQLHLNLPEARIFYFGIEPEVNSDNQRSQNVNAAIENFANHTDWVTYIKSPEWCLDKTGAVNADYYRDGVHIKLQNYYLYTKALEKENISVKPSSSTWILPGMPQIEKDVLIANSEKMYGSVPAPASRTRMRIQFGKPLKENSVIKFNGDSKTFKWAVVTFENTDRKTNYDSAWSVADNWKGDENRLTYRLNGNLYVTLTVAYYDDREISNDALDSIYSMFDVYGEFGDSTTLTERRVKSINHRGYNTIAPENTLSAFELSAKKGFGFVECDVSFTNDNVPVILHDNTVDRTSDGSGVIGSFTYEAVRKLDFGSWKSEAYKGEKIPSLAEFADLCKRLGLHAYIELKTQGTSPEQVKIAYDIVKNVGINDNVTWISFGADLLKVVHEIDPSARIGFVVNSVNDTVINEYYKLSDGGNEAFIDCNVVNLNDYAVSLLKKMNIPLEVWTVDSGAVIAGLDKYVSGFTSNSLNAQDVLKSLTGDRIKAAVSVGTNGNGTAELSGTDVLDGEKVTVKLTPKEGYILSSLKVNGENIISQVNDNEITIIVNGDTIIEADFETLSNFVLVTYHIGDTSDERLVRKGSEYIYPVTPTKPDDGIKYYKFAGWFDGEDYANEITDFSFDEDTDLYAKFDEDIYTFAINYSAIDIDNLFGEQLTAVTGYKGELSWQKISGSDAISVDKNGKVTATAEGNARIGLFVLEKQMAVCEVTARIADKNIIDDYKGERTNVYHNITNGTRALLQSGSRYLAGTRITLKTQYRDKYQWSVSQIYKLPAENGYLFDPG